MKHMLPPLPYAKNALEPYVSKETLDYHYGKHHRAYINTLNALIEGGEYANATLEEIVLNATNDIFNNAAQVWNHNFYWQCLSPQGGGKPSSVLAKAIEAAFSSVAAFKNQFSQIAEKTFGSGWVWLVHDQSGTLSILSTHNAGTPLRSGLRALLTCDVWEHAYYIDRRNARPDYIKAFWQIVNWDFVARNLFR